VHIICICGVISNLLIKPTTAWAEIVAPQVMVDIYDPPAPIQILDKHYLIYELYVTNFYPQNICLEAIEIKDKASGMALVGFDRNALQKMMQSASNEKNISDETILPAGVLKIVYMMVPFNSQNDIPKDFTHRLIFVKNTDNDRGEGAREEMNTLPLTVEKPLQMMISPPVKGDYWVATNGLSNTSLHRRAHYITNGQNYFTQRYAADFVKIDLNGKTYAGNKRENSSYYSYGKNVFAVARGTVVAVKEGHPDTLPQSNLTSFNSNPGNYIILELGRGLYAFYSHLKPDSIQVKVGQKIDEGQVLAQIGNSGASNEPGLHFHIADKSSFLSGNGLPFTFTEFWVYPSQAVQMEDNIEYKLKEAPEGIRRYSNQLLFENTVVKFQNEAVEGNAYEMNRAHSDENP
jgi:hypothetical protein